MSQDDTQHQNTTPPETYDESAIQVDTQAETIRKRPGMYASHAHEQNIRHAMFEMLVSHQVFHNVLHERLARTIVTLHEDGSATVEDFGVGYALPETSEQLLEVFNDFGGPNRAHGAAVYPAMQHYTDGISLHSIPALAFTSALSTQLTFESRRDGKRWSQAFSRGVPVGELQDLGATERTGTRVTFDPDTDHLKEERGFDFEMVSTDLERLAWMYPGLRVHLLEEGTMRTHEAFYPNGASDLIARHHDIPQDQIFSSRIPVTADQKRGLDVALCWRDEGALDAPSNIESMINDTSTRAHGSHIEGLGAGIMEALLHVAEAHTIQWKIGVVELGMIARVRVQDVDAKRRHDRSEQPIFYEDDKVRDFVATSIAEHLTPWLAARPQLVANLLEKMHRY